MSDKILMQLPVSVKEARKLLGINGSKLSEPQVVEIINTLELLAKVHFQNRGSNKSEGV